MLAFASDCLRNEERHFEGNYCEQEPMSRTMHLHYITVTAFS